MEQKSPVKIFNNYLAHWSLLSSTRIVTIFWAAPVISVWLFSFADAQEQVLKNCNGRWTNRDCNPNEVIRTLPENNSSRVLSPDEARERTKREVLFHQLGKKNSEAAEKYGVRIDLGSAEDLCIGDARKQALSLELCRAEVERLEDRLDKKINFELVKDENDKHNTNEEKKSGRSTKNPRLPDALQPTNTGGTTIIIREQIPFSVRGHRDFYDHRSRGESRYRVHRHRQHFEGVPPTPSINTTP